MFSWFLDWLAPGKGPNLEFTNWTSEISTKIKEGYTGVSLSYKEYKEAATRHSNETKENVDPVVYYKKNINGRLGSQQEISIDLDTEIEIKIDSPTEEKLNTERCIQRIIVGSNDIQARLERLTIGQLIIKNGRETVIFVDNCFISEIFIESAVGNELKITDSHIGHLKLVDNGSGVIKNLNMRGGSILRVTCPTQENKNPFRKAVEFINVFMPHTRRYGMIEPQELSYLVYHLREMDNYRDADFVHAAEQAQYRYIEESWTTKVISILYEVGSNFGSSQVRPIIWIITLLVTASVLFYSMDTATLQLDIKYYKGWKLNLIGNEIQNKVWRAGYLSFQSMINPLAVVSAKSLLVAKDGWGVFITIIHSILSTVLIALFFLSVRRKFKMN